MSDYYAFSQGSPFNTGTANARTSVLHFSKLWTPLLTLHSPARNTNASLLYKVTCSSKLHVASSSRWPPRLSRLILTVSKTAAFILSIHGLIKSPGYVRDASAPVFGVFHGSEVAYFFGFGNQSDYIATDALSKYSQNTCIRIL
jgi:hypothetical protein